MFFSTVLVTALVIGLLFWSPVVALVFALVFLAVTAGYLGRSDGRIPSHMERHGLMSDIEITMTARIKVDANEWAYEHGVPLEDVADDILDYIRDNVGHANNLINLKWK